MSYTHTSALRPKFLNEFLHWGMFWLLVAVLGAAVFFADGLGALLEAWKLPEYSHGPLIPALSGLLFLRQMKDLPIQTGPKPSVIKSRYFGPISADARHGEPDLTFGAFHLGGSIKSISSVEFENVA